MKRLSVLLVILISFSLCGCGSTVETSKINELEKTIAELQRKLDESNNKEVLPVNSDTPDTGDIDSEESAETSEMPKGISKDEAFSQQLLIVTDTGVQVQSDDYKSLYPDMLQAFIKNVSEDTVKDCMVSFLAFDEKGYPLKIKGQVDFQNGKYERQVEYSGINLSPGDTFGEDFGFSIDENLSIKYVLACVLSAEFYKDGKWDNPYHKYWIDEYCEKPVDVEVLKNLTNKI